MTYRFGESTYRSTRGRVSSFHDRDRRTNSDSYHNANRESFSTNSFQSSSHRRNDYRDSRGRGTYRYNGERDSFVTPHSRRDEDSCFHRRESRDFSPRSCRREHFHSRQSDGESDRKRMRIDVADSFKEGYSSRRSHDEQDHPHRSLNCSSSSPYRPDSGPFGDKSYQKDYNNFKRPSIPSNGPSYSGRRPTRGIRSRIRINMRPTPSFSRRNETSRFKPPSRLQLSLRKKKQILIMRMRKDRESRDRPPSSGKLSYAEDNKRTEEFRKDTNIDDGPPGMSSFPARKTPIKEESVCSPEKSRLQSKSPEFKYRTPSFERSRRIALKCPHCKMECQMFRTYQAHLVTHRHKAAMAKLLYRLKQKLRCMRTEQREKQRIIDDREGSFNLSMYCKLCKLNYKQTRQEHVTSDYHVSMSEFLNSRCNMCRMDFESPLSYQHHRCTLTHIKLKAFLKRNEAEGRDQKEENNDDENFMVLDSVGPADESNENVDTSKENIDSPRKTSLEAKRKTTIIGNEYIKQVSIYYCELCKLSLNYHPNQDAEDALLSHCRTRFHLKRFSLVDSKKSRERISNGENHSGEKSAGNTSVEAVDNNDAENEKKVVEKVGDAHNLSLDEDDSNSGNTSRYDRFSISDENANTDMIRAEPIDNVQSKKGFDLQQNVAKSERK